jgi:hypothetical protein
MEHEGELEWWVLTASRACRRAALGARSEPCLSQRARAHQDRFFRRRVRMDRRLTMRNERHRVPAQGPRRTARARGVQLHAGAAQTNFLVGVPNRGDLARDTQQRCARIRRIRLGKSWAASNRSRCAHGRVESVNLTLPPLPPSCCAGKAMAESRQPSTRAATRASQEPRKRMKANACTIDLECARAIRAGNSGGSLRA